mmetsp:Transcript_47909/g.103985  ORF Transcript_47909/g.103985 Transcript_47909/m.103985 type:complete len:138 (+) Transcript_47909:285-698(+)
MIRALTPRHRDMDSGLILRLSVTMMGLSKRRTTVTPSRHTTADMAGIGTVYRLWATVTQRAHRRSTSLRFEGLVRRITATPTAAKTTIVPTRRGQRNLQLEQVGQGGLQGLCRWFRIAQSSANWKPTVMVAVGGTRA